MGFVVVFLVGADLLLRAIWLPAAQRSSGLRIVMIVVAVLPLVVVGLSIIRPRTGTALGLLRRIPTQAVIDPSGIELSIDGWMPESARWDEISGLARTEDDWRLFGPDGATVLTIPRELVRPRPSWFDGPTLAEAVVQIRPDRKSVV